MSYLLHWYYVDIFLSFSINQDVIDNVAQDVDVIGVDKKITEQSSGSLKADCSEPSCPISKSRAVFMYLLFVWSSFCVTHFFIYYIFLNITYIYVYIYIHIYIYIYIYIYIHMYIYKVHVYIRLMNCYTYHMTTLFSFLTRI